jgi:hypothetical protein
VRLRCHAAQARIFNEISLLNGYSILRIAVDRKHTHPWLFLEEKATGVDLLSLQQFGIFATA